MYIHADGSGVLGTYRGPLVRSDICHLGCHGDMWDYVWCGGSYRLLSLPCITATLHVSQRQPSV